MNDLYQPGSGIEVPGLEAILEYGDVGEVSQDRISDALLINDHSRLERVRITSMDGLHDDPDGRDTRTPNPDRHGERAGQLLYGGKTIGLTGRVEAGNIGAMRDLWRRLRGQFDTSEHDLLIHPPYEVARYVNQVCNPDFVADNSHWASNSPSGSRTITQSSSSNEWFATFEVSTATGAGFILGTPSDFVPWNGEDVWVHAVLRTAVALTSLQVGILTWSTSTPAVGTGIAHATVAQQSSPSIGTNYELSVRIPASAIARNVKFVGLMLRGNFGAAGTFSFIAQRADLVLLKSTEATPAGHISSIVPGFEDSGAGTVSYGPCYAVNLIADPTCSTTAVWAAVNDSGVTQNMFTSSKAWAGGDAPMSIFYDGTATASGKKIQLKNWANIPAFGGRTYRFRAKVNVEESSVGFYDCRLQFLDRVGSVLGTFDSSYQVSSGVIDVDVSGQAPAATTSMVVLIGMITHTSTAGSQNLRYFITDPCLLDISQWDVGVFVGNANAAEEISTPVTLPTWSSYAGARRRIPRPFMVRKARKTSDMKAPEQQSRSRAWRDFTMSLRAGDPRIYQLDQLSRSMAITGSPQFTSTAPPAVTANGAITTAPTGFTVEGQSGTTGYTYSLINRVGPPWGGGGAFNPPGWSVYGGSGQASDAIARAYRSAEGWTYTNPRVVIGGHVVSNRVWPPPSGFSQIFPWRFLSVSLSMDYNSLGILLKRVASGTWLEVRWNSTNHLEDMPAGSPNDSPYSIEIWASHDATGTAGATRLAQWDIPMGEFANSPTTYVGGINPFYLVAWLDTSNVVHAELWRTYPSTTNTSDRLVSSVGSYTLPSPLITLMGSAVAGQVGYRVKSEAWDTAGNYPIIVDYWGQPWVSYFEAQRADVADTSVTCPVIGDVDSPQRIVLRGDVLNPVLTIASPTQTSVARFNGTITDANPVTIDLYDSSVKDSGGANKYDMLLAGSSFVPFQPGLNTVTLRSPNWGAYPAHANVFWRNALL